MNTNAGNSIRAASTGNLSVWCGDEVTYGNGASKTDLRYSSLTCNDLGLEEHNHAASGAGFAVTDNSIDTQLDEAASSIGADNSSVSWVMLMAGLRDPYDRLTDMQQIVQTTIAKAKSLFPQAQIVVGCGPGCIPEDTNDDANENQEHILTAIRLAAEKSEAYVIPDMRAICGNDPSLRDDGISPNDAGHAALADSVVTAIRECSGEPLDTPVVVRRKYRPSQADFLSRTIQTRNRREAEKREANRPTGTELNQLTSKLDALTRAQGLQQVILQQQQEQLRQQQEMLDRQQQQLKQQQDALASQQEQLKQQQEQLSGVVGQQGSTLASLQSLTARLDTIQNQTLQTIGVNLQNLFTRTDQLLDRVQALEDRGSVGA